MEALENHTAMFLTSGESETDKFPPGSYVIHDECGCEESGEEEEGGSEIIRAIKDRREMKRQNCSSKIGSKQLDW